MLSYVYEHLWKMHYDNLLFLFVYILALCLIALLLMACGCTFLRPETIAYRQNDV
jgi:Trk-type K+ transport system membrane component